MLSVKLVLLRMNSNVPTTRLNFLKNTQSLPKNWADFLQMVTYVSRVVVIQSFRAPRHLTLGSAQNQNSSDNLSNTAEVALDTKT